MSVTHIITDVYGVLLTSEGENTALLHWLFQQKQKGSKLYLGSNVSSEKAQLLHQQAHWKSLFTRFFASGDIGYTKPSEAFFLYIEKELHIQDPDNVFFIDDMLENVYTARHLGWRGYHYKGWEEFHLLFNEGF